MGKQKREFPLRETASGAVQHKSAEVMRLWLCTRESQGRMSASWAPCIQVWAPLVGWRQHQSLWCTTTTQSTADQMARAYSIKGGKRGCTRRCPVAAFYKDIDMAGINARILFKECTSRKRAQSPAATLRGAEGRIHGGERGCGSQHKVGSSKHGHGGSAGPKELQTEPNVGHLKCHKPMWGNCARRAEVICIDCVATALCLFLLQISSFPAFSIIIIILLYIIIKCFTIK